MRNTRFPTSLLLACVAVACGDDGGELEHSAIPHCNPGYAWPIAAEAGSFADAADIVELGGGQRDVVMPGPVRAWLTEHGWQQQHDDWHNVRRWDQSCRRSNATAEGPDGVAGTDDDCDGARRLQERGFARAAIQEGAPGDGVAFLAMHRHMLAGVRAAFPDHPELFSSFEHVPRGRDDPENPTPWRDVSWSAAQLAAIEKLEHLDEHLDEFPTEDDLALYIEVPFRWTPENPSVFVSDSSSGIHFMLHAQWSVFGSPALLGNGPGVIENAVFWKLHGWIDDVWQRYRDLKGLRNDDPEHVRLMVEQCEEMHALDERNFGAHEDSHD